VDLEMLQSNADLSRRLNNLERKYDAQLKQVFHAIRELMEPIQKPKHRLGFKDDR
jgi:hypothetical protein